MADCDAETGKMTKQVMTEPSAEDKLSFDNFRISSETKQKLMAKGITALFPIQAATFDLIYDGLDVVGRARTGTGKSLAFALPVVEKLKLSMTN